MKVASSIVRLAIVCSALGCDGAPEEIVQPEPIRVDLECIEYVTLKRVQFDEKLQEWWDANYPGILARQRALYQGLTEAEYEQLARAEVYRYLPFRGTEDCLHPEIDFSMYTLLGSAAGASGCEKPLVTFRYTPPKDGKPAILALFVTEYGTCEMAWWESVWLLVPTVPKDVGVEFQEHNGPGQE
jgi:hypothetical protein